MNSPTRYSSDLALPPGEVHVWCADPRALVPEARSAAAVALLDDGERARHQGLQWDSVRLLHLASRALVRRTLSRYRPLHPREWEFTLNQHGCPRIADHQPKLHFNLSNTRDLVTIAVSADLEVGIDAEPLDRKVWLAVADRYFAASEVAALHALPPEAQPRRFLDYWTLKESYIKARQMGLAIPLRRFAFTWEAGQPRLYLDPSLGDSAARWQFLQFTPTADHLCALCNERPQSGEAKIVQHVDTFSDD